MMVHCPSCSARLNVSRQAAGHSVRCPRCKKPFKVPNNEGEIVEDTVACWLEISAEEEQARKQQAASVPDPLEDLPEYVPPPDLDLHAPGAGESATAVQAKPAAAPVKPAVPPAKPALPAPPVIKTKPVNMPAPQAITPRVAPRPDLGAESPMDPAHIRLHVAEVHATGVVLEFSSQLLGRGAFRASFPMRCAGCGSAEVDPLIARPLIWTDRLSGGHRSVAELWAKYEQPVKGQRSTQDILAMMRPVEEMLPPYNHPVAYYGCTSCGSHATVATSMRTSPGGTTCRVTVPDASCALEWVGRVNGVCGDEYLELDAFCARSGGGGEAWNALPEQIRTRIGGWFQPGDGEQFIHYYKDGDYPKADAGLGGLVLTNQRLVYSKYQKHGAILIHEDDVQLLAVRRGPFDDLLASEAGVRSKLVRLRPDDTDQLAAALVELGAKVGLERAES